jgi:phosphatidylinositol-3-phosphatase
VVPIGKDDESLGAIRATSCASCGATLASSQRYCLECGERRGPLPAAISKWLSVVEPGEGGEKPAGDPEAAGAGLGAIAAADPGSEDSLDPPDDISLAERYMPEPRSAAIAVMALLAFGVVAGAATGPIAQSAGISPIVVEMSQSTPPSSPVETASSTAPAEAAPATTPVATPSSVPVAEPPPLEAPATTTPPKTSLPPELPETETLPPIEHVFMIVLGDQGYEAAFGKSSTAPYLASTLPAKGELLTNYYAVAQGDLANEIALLSGQGPTPATAANCPDYTDIAPATVGESEQVAGEGCVYPSQAQTLPGQLTAAKKSWKAYVEDIGNGAGQATTCRHPALGGPDDAQAARPGDAYETWRNPFVYFHSLIDGPECVERDVGLPQLETDLESEKQTPALSYIVPNACHDGSEEACQPGQPAGLAAAQPFLETVVPEIEASAAYRKGGLIAITFAQAPQTGPSADSSACCATPEYPNMPPATAPPAAATGPVKPSGGGGRVGALLISPYVEPGSVNETGYYNHFSLLLSIDELFGLTPIGYAANPALTAFDSTVFNLSS